MAIDRTDPVVADLDKRLEGTRRVLERIPDAELDFRPHSRAWTLGERGTHVSHMIHHRGQLTVYLRLVGAPVPGPYGPSADEPGGGG